MILCNILLLCFFSSFKFNKNKHILDIFFQKICFIRIYWIILNISLSLDTTVSNYIPCTFSLWFFTFDVHLASGFF